MGKDAFSRLGWAADADEEGRLREADPAERTSASVRIEPGAEAVGPTGRRERSRFPPSTRPERPTASPPSSASRP